MGKPGKARFSKRTSASSIPSSIRLKKSVCVILPRVDVSEFLRERKRRSLSLSQGAQPSNGSTSPPPSTCSAPAVRIKRRYRVKKEPPCIFHSQIDINDDAVEEIPGVLEEPVRNEAVCLHDITRSMCYMCSPHPTAEDKSQVWDEINDDTRASSTSGYRGWHVPTPFVPEAAAAIQAPPVLNSVESSTSVPFRSIEPLPSRIEANVPISADIGVGTGDDFVAVQTREQSTQTVRYFSCKHCLALFTDVAHLIHHKAVHQKMFECPFCTANFVSKNDLKSHMKLHMLPKYYDCVYCSQAFTKKHDIRDHLALHAEQKQFRCQQCPARFPQKNNLRNHEQSHNVSKFIHVFKKVDDDSILNSTTSPTKTVRRSVGSTPTKETATSTVSTAEGTRNIGATSKPSKSPRRSVSCLKKLPAMSPISSSGPSRVISSVARPTSYLALSSITDRPSTSSFSASTSAGPRAASFSASTSAGPRAARSVTISTNAETPVLPVNESEVILNNITNFFRCQFCPLSYKTLRGFKTHNICHTRKRGKFVCTFCGGKFIKKIGLTLHMKYSHTLA